MPLLYHAIAGLSRSAAAKHYPCPDFLLLVRLRKRALYVMTHSGLMLRVSLHAWRRRRGAGVARVARWGIARKSFA